MFTWVRLFEPANWPGGTNNVPRRLKADPLGFALSQAVEDLVVSCVMLAATDET